jgi:hypothetical protein
LLPGFYTPQQGLGVPVSLRLILICPTVRRVLMVSGTIEDNFLIFGNLAYPGLEFPQGNSTL